MKKLTMNVSDDFFEVLKGLDGGEQKATGVTFIFDNVHIYEGALECTGAFQSWMVSKGSEATKVNKMHDEHGIFGQREEPEEEPHICDTCANFDDVSQYHPADQYEDCLVGRSPDSYHNPGCEDWEPRTMSEEEMDSAASDMGVRRQPGLLGTTKNPNTSGKATRYTVLLTAVQDLLCELRIDEGALEDMAEGYSPDYPGPRMADPARGTWHNPRREGFSSYCKVQLSQVVAQKLVNAGVIDHRDKMHRVTSVWDDRDEPEAFRTPSRNRPAMVDLAEHTPEAEEKFQRALAGAQRALELNDDCIEGMSRVQLLRWLQTHSNFDVLSEVVNLFKLLARSQKMHKKRRGQVDKIRELAESHNWGEAARRIYPYQILNIIGNKKSPKKPSPPVLKPVEKCLYGQKESRFINLNSEGFKDVLDASADYVTEHIREVNGATDEGVLDWLQEHGSVTILREVVNLYYYVIMLQDKVKELREELEEVASD